jgi:hypothetical protein
VHGRQ